MDIRFVSGFLGSGKTTFIKAYLQNQSKRVGVIVNDFGDTSVDALLLEGLASMVDDVSGGSMFCACKSNDFIKTLSRMAEHDLDEILVETSGFSNPSSTMGLLQHVTQMDSMTYRGLITLVAANVFDKVVNTCVAARKQIEHANLVFVTKMDLIDEPFEAVVTRIQQHNAHAAVHRVDHGRYDDAWLKNMTASLGDEPATMDVSLRRASVEINSEPSVEALRQFLSEVWVYAERIKGTLHTEAGLRYVEYDEEGLRITEAIKRPSTGLTVLGRSPTMKLNAVARICEKYDFATLIRKKPVARF